MTTGNAKLTCKSIYLLPGVADDFDERVAEVIEDCRRRPGEQRSREVTLKIQVKPSKNDENDVHVTPIVSSKRPAVEHESVLGRASGRGQSAQLTFEFEDQEM